MSTETNYHRNHYYNRFTDFNTELSCDYSNNIINPKLSLRPYCYSQNSSFMGSGSSINHGSISSVSSTSINSANSSVSTTPSTNFSLSPVSSFQSLPKNYEPYNKSFTKSPKSDSESNGGVNKKRKRCNLPKRTTKILIDWLNDNLNNPYPNSKEKYELISKTGLTNQQLSNWFINARRRKINNLREQKN